MHICAIDLFSLSLRMSSIPEILSLHRLVQSRDGKVHQEYTLSIPQVYFVKILRCEFAMDTFWGVMKDHFFYYSSPLMEATTIFDGAIQNENISVDKHAFFVENILRYDNRLLDDFSCNCLEELRG